MHYAHVAHFLGDDENALVTRLSEFFLGGLRHDCALVMITSPARRDAVLRRLPPGTDVTWFDSQSMLAEIANGGRVDPYAFDKHVGGALRTVRHRNGSRPVYAFGDMVGLLWSRDQRSTAADLEWYWNDLGAQVPFSLYCAYPIEACDSADRDVREIARLHSEVVA